VQPVWLHTSNSILYRCLISIYTFKNIYWCYSIKSTWIIIGIYMQFDGTSLSLLFFITILFQNSRDKLFIQRSHASNRSSCNLFRQFPKIKSLHLKSLYDFMLFISNTVYFIRYLSNQTYSSYHWGHYNYDYSYSIEIDFGPEFKGYGPSTYSSNHG